MALDALREQCAIAAEAKRNYEQQLAIRDDLIRAARAAKIPESKLQSITGLSRDRISTIAHSAPKGVSLT